MIMTIMISESDQINDAVCLSNQGSCSSGIWPRLGRKTRKRDTNQHYQVIVIIISMSMVTTTTTI